MPQNRMLDGDTIAAIATPIGVGGVGVVRISGSRSLEILQSIIDKNPQTIDPRYSYFGNIPKVDEVLYVYFKAPSSYTGEDVVEISCHGGVSVSKKILELCIEKGARQAKNGEFTKRAFLAGRIDLAQAEAVISLISAKTEEGREASATQLTGGLSSKINEMREGLIGAMAKIEAAIDFPDDVEINRKELEAAIVGAIENAGKLIASSRYGKILRDGVLTAIAGKPNVGKSTLFNALLKDARAIVTEDPGTTRDTIEETVNVLGLPLKLIDTAGIRTPKNKPEELGIERTKTAINDAEMVIMVLDGSNNRLEDEDRILLEMTSSKPRIVAINKIDQGNKLQYPGVKISALSGEGMEGLEAEIYAKIMGEGGAPDCSATVINLRHKECLLRAKECLQKAAQSVKMGREDELIAIDLKDAIEALGEITGIGVSEEIIDRIFEGFCVGK